MTSRLRESGSAIPSPAGQDEPSVRATVARVTFRGEVDLTSIAPMRIAVERAVNTNAATVVVNLGAVTFFNSTGLALLTRTRTVLRHQGRTLELEEVPACVARLLTITGLQSLSSPSITVPPQPTRASR